MGVTPTWRPHPNPRAPSGLVAFDSAVRRLLDRLSMTPDAPLRLGSFGQYALVVLGPEADLPWVDGALYVVDSPEAPGLFLPTTLEPSVPVGLVRAAVLDAGYTIPAIVLPPGDGHDAPLVMCLKPLTPLSADVIANLR
jgi:hypothetical protein